MRCRVPGLDFSGIQGAARGMQRSDTEAENGTAGVEACLLHRCSLAHGMQALVSRRSTEPNGAKPEGTGDEARHASRTHVNGP